MAKTISMPKLGFDMAEGTLVRWVKSEGETIAKGEVLAEIETDKATVEVEAQYSGVLRKHIVAEGTAVPVGSPIAIIGDADEPIDVEALISQPSEAAETIPSEAMAGIAEEQAETGHEKGRLPGGVKATPIARRIAREHGMNLAAITGSGQDGRIVRRDVEKALLKAEEAAPVAEPEIAPVPPATLGPGVPSAETISIPLTKLRSLIGRRMTTAKQQIPHFYLTAEYDVKALLNLRLEMNQRLGEGEQLSINDFIIRAAALALRQFPNLNASLGDGAIIRHGDINIGVAVAMEEGLLTVVIRLADQKSIRAISEEVRSMVSRAREGRVKPEDVEGSTFTVSNLGMYEIEDFVAIINPPEAAILAIGNVHTTPVIEDERVIAGQRMKVTLSADHRVTDGAEAAQWLQILRRYLEDPLLLLI
jgi:pyruvate dehydrogenase E2 component (dihydrolipoamide acetyltransferase)